jgi:hypothetical protein
MRSAIRHRPREAPPAATELARVVRGGNTDVDGLALQCRRQNVADHEGGHELIRSPDGNVAQLS